MSRRHVYPGVCHCRNLSLRLHSDQLPRELGVRTDSCSFCNKHHALYTSDPAGAVDIAVARESDLERYRFGTKTADFLLCRRCGVFIAALMPEERLAVVNVNVLEARSDFLELSYNVADLEGESLPDRLTRRQKRWTPVVRFDVGAS